LEHSSSEGLQHEAGNVQNILDALAYDVSTFPELLTAEQDPTVGLWNNWYGTDPGFTSDYLYVSIFDAFMIAMPMLYAQVFFVITALAVPLVTLPAVWGRLSFAFLETAVCFVAVLLGVGSGLFHARIVARRDLRTWYDWQFVRFTYLAFGALFPTLLIQTLRTRLGRRATDHTLVLTGALWATCGFLLLAALFLPHLGSLVVWFPICAAIALGGESAMSKESSSQGPEAETAARELTNMAADEPLVPELGATASEREVKRLPLDRLLVRDVLSIGLPSVFTIAIAYNVINSLSFVLDGIPGYSRFNGALCGLFGVLAGLPYLSARQRLTGRSLSLCLTFELILYVALNLLVMFLPTDVSKACHWNSVECHTDSLQAGR